jgi:F-type H+-transporting ATPase subunit a
VFSVIFVHGFSKCGFIGFFKNMIPKGIPLPIGIFVFFLELFGLLIKNSVLAVRLFANMIAGHLVIGSLLVLIFIIHPLAAFVSVPMAVAISLLEVLVAFIQAMVFTMLSAIFIGMASSHH